MGGGESPTRHVLRLSCLEKSNFLADLERVCAAWALSDQGKRFERLVAHFVPGCFNEIMLTCLVVRTHTT